MSGTPVFIMNDGRYVKEEHFDRVEKELADAQADADHWKGECNALQRMVHEARAEIERKDKLVEQMRGVLRGVCEKCPCDIRLEDARCKDCDVGAALSAAERGEGL